MVEVELRYGSAAGCGSTWLERRARSSCAGARGGCCSPSWFSGARACDPRRHRRGDLGRGWGAAKRRSPSRPRWRSSSAAAPHTSAAPRVSSFQRGYDGLTDPAERARAAIRLSHLLLFVRSPADGVELAQRATEELPDEPGLDDFRDGLRAVRLIGAAFGAVDPAEFRALDGVRRGPRGTGPGGRALTAMTALVVALTCGRAPEASALASESFSAGAASFVRIGASAALLGSESRNRWFQLGADDQPQLQLRLEASPARLT